MLTRKLADEIARQLHGDILSYDWLLKITEEQLVGKSFSERTTALAESLELLMKEEGVTIGPSKPQNPKTPKPQNNQQIEYFFKKTYRPEKLRQIRV